MGKIAAVGFAAAMTALTAVPASAFPVPAGGLPDAARAPASAPVEQVKCTGCAVGAGVAAGVIAGAAIANANRGYYAPPPPPPPAYYARPVYGPAPGRCWVETNPVRGTGYWARC